MRAFVDATIIVSMESEDATTAGRAVAIIGASPVISVQVIDETVNALMSKHGYTLTKAHAVASSLLGLCKFAPLDANTLRTAIRLAGNDGLSHRQAMLAATALLASCDTFYSEELPHGRIFDGRLTVTNPFL